MEKVSTPYKCKAIVCSTDFWVFGKNVCTRSLRMKMLECGITMKTHIIQEETELGTIASEIITSFTQKESAHIVTLRGDLGVGKTALTKHIAHILGIHELVTSPTFVIMKSYPIAHHAFLKKLIHIDAYRIESDDELRVLGFEALCAEPHTLVCIEWPERIVVSLRNKMVYPVTLAIDTQENRMITYGY